MSASAKPLLATSSDPLWFKDAVIYQLHVKAFCDSNDDGIGDFPGLTSRLDYLHDLGVNVLWLLPFYPSPMRDDGYDIADYRDIYPAYGTLKDFREFVREAHRRGLKVITELVINHTSDQHPWFQAARRAKPGSAARDFYVWSDDDKKFPETRIIFTDTETSNWAWDPVAKAYYWHRFFSHQPDLNHNNPKVVDAVIKVMRFWLDMGVDGMRLDAIPYLCVREGTDNENLPETHDVIRKMRSVVDANYQGRMFLAEANQWPEDVCQYFGNGDECHMAYHFPLMPRMFMAVALEDRYPVTEILRQTPDIPENCQWAIFLRNHDELTLEMVTDQERDYMYRMYAQEPRMRVNVGIRRRLAPLLDNDVDRIKLLNSLLLSMPGSPIIYYGDEIGMGDNIFLGDRNGVRTPMQWSIDRNAGFSRADPQQLYLPVIMDPIYGYQAVNVEAQRRDRSSLLNWMKRLLAIRRRHHAFGRGTLEIVRPANRKILAYLRRFDGETVLCVANLSATAQAVELDLSQFKGCVPLELLGNNTFPPIGELPYFLTLQGYDFFWLQFVPRAQAPQWHLERLPAAELPVVVLAGGLSTFAAPPASADRQVVARANALLEKEVLPDFMRQRRWFAGKSVDVRAVSLGNRILWHTERGTWLIAMPEVSLANGEIQTYCLPFTITWENDATSQALRSVEWALAKVRERSRAGMLVDAFADPAFCLAVAEAMGTDTRVELPNGDIRCSHTSAYAALIAKGPQPVSHPAGEQSNTAVFLGEAVFLKAYRQLRTGINPEIEMTRFLTEVAQYPNFAPLAGVVEFVPRNGEPITMGALFAFVRNQGDGWSYTLNHLDRFVASFTTDKTIEAPHTLYITQIEVLGRRVGEFHRALAGHTQDAAFAPAPFDATDMREEAQLVRAEAEITLSRLQQASPHMDASVREQVHALLDAREQLFARIDALGSKEIHTIKTRFHGDLHLGQVLVVAGDFYIIDFEGEPSRPMDQRRRKQSPLIDVAGMLRSFDYARVTGLERALAVHTGEHERFAPEFEKWRLAAVESFLKGYVQGVGDAPCYPKDPADAGALIALFEIGKALYEIRYELERRPTWVGVPVTGVLRTLQAGG